MTAQEDTRKKSRRDLLLVLLILPLGVLCMFMTGQVAIQLAPEWVLNADMLSLLDPDAEFAIGKPFSIPPLNPNILTLPPWSDLFLTPNVSIPTRVIRTATPQPPARTPRPVVVTPDDPDPTATSDGPVIVPTRPEPLMADLLIEKSDNSRTYTPGTAINYTILVTNLGPDDASRFNVVDEIPEVITGISVNCTPADLCGTNTSTGNKVAYHGANLPGSGNRQITIAVSGMVVSSATGDLSNRADIEIPPGSGYRDPRRSNNYAIDTDRQRSVHDLAITKGDGVETYTATDPIIYTIVIRNSGPSDARRISVSDDLPAQIASWTWVCTRVVRAAGCNEVTNSTSSFTDIVNIHIGGRIEYTVTAIPALLPQNPQNLSNTANVVLPGGPNFIDPNLSNNSATDTNSPYIDLYVTKDDGLVSYTPGGVLPYIVTVTNASTFNLTGVHVMDTISPMIRTWTWYCTPGPGAACSPGSVDTDIDDTAVFLPPGISVEYHIDATVHDAAAGTLDNTVTVDPPAGLVDALPADNTATDSDTSAVVTEPNIGPSNGNLPIPQWTEGDPPIIIVFGPPILADGDVGTPDFVYYEFEDADNLGNVALDWVQIEISTDGASWITVFNWMTGTPPDTNSNVVGACAGEDDNCLIPFGNLYNQTGVTIDIDSIPGIVQGAGYSWIRITAPTSPAGDAPEVDAIQPYYP